LCHREINFNCSGTAATIVSNNSASLASLAAKRRKTSQRWSGAAAETPPDAAIKLHFSPTPLPLAALQFIRHPQCGF